MKALRVFTLLFLGFAIGVFSLNLWLQHETRVNERAIKELDQEIQKLEKQHYLHTHKMIIV
jgi:hypothetical protein